MSRNYNLVRQNLDTRDLKFAQYESIEPLDRVDFRPFCPPVYDQGSLGSCTSNAYLALRRMLVAVEGNDIKVDYSRLKHYYDERVMEETVDTDSGAQMRTGAKVLKNIGTCLESIWPYIPDKFSDEPSEAAKLDSANYKIKAYKMLNNFMEIKQYLTKQQQLGKPMGVAGGIEIYSSFEGKAVVKTGMVPVPNKSKEQFLGGHAILIVGYDDNFKKGNSMFCQIVDKLLGTTSSGYVMCQNSWGEDWGDKGFFYLPYEFVRNNAFDFWVIE